MLWSVFFILFLAESWAQNQVPDIIIPPNIYKPEAPYIRYIPPEEDQTVVNCQANGDPAPVYKWYYAVPGGTRSPVLVTNFINFNAMTGDLTIKGFTSRENGEYQCLASNRFEAASISPVITLKKMRLEEMPIVTKTVSSTEYSYLRLQCDYDAVADAKEIIYKWYQGETASEISMDGGRLYVDAVGDLHFTYTKQADASAANKGLYKCGLSTSTSARKIVFGPIYTLSIMSRSVPLVSAPVLSYNNSGVKVNLYTTGHLECFFSGYSPTDTIPQVKWTTSWSNEEIVADDIKYKLSPFGRRLSIMNATETDEGFYYCSATNGQGTSSRIPVRMDLISPPIWERDGRPIDQVQPEGKTATFKCATRSLANEIEPRSPKWTLNVHQEIQRGDLKYQLSNDKKKLTVVNLSKKTDNVCIQCEVENSYGTVQANACLRVILPIDVMKQPKLYQEIKYGDTVDLTVVAKTDPSINNMVYLWRFDNKTYDPALPYMNYNPNTFEAYINTSKLTIEEYKTIGGVYERIIEHPYETKIISIEVVLDGNIGALADSAEFDWWIIGLILSIICLIIVLALIIFVCYRKQQEGDYNVDKKENTAGLDPEKELKDNQFDNYSPPAYADYDDYPDKKVSSSQPNLDIDDIGPIEGDDESLGEYGYEEPRYFSEDGSFIGQYEAKQPNKRPHATESTI